VDIRKDKKTAPIKPFDDTIWEKWSIYDNAPYIQNVDMRSDNNFALVSGNIIKSYRCLIKEPYELKNE
jgi:hypothetical protein